MKIQKIATLIATFAGISLLGCEGDKPAATTPDTKVETPKEDAQAEPAEPAGEPGGIKVTVVFEGAAPKAKALNRKSDPFCAKTKKTDPSVLVKNGKLQNTIVRIASKVKTDAKPPADPIKITQKECMYEPRVNTAMTGQQIYVTNDDGTLHNVHAYKGENKENWFNNAQPPKAPPIKKDLEDGMVQLKCDVHPWMSSYISVASHPFNSVTGADGIVTWEGIPSKSKPYRIEAWHEVYGKQEVKVKVEAGKVAEVTITYSADKAAN